MDLPQPAGRAFRDEVRRFLDEHLTEDLREAGRKTGGVFADMDAGLRWHKVLAKRGWSAPTWPAEYGGTGWTRPSATSSRANARRRAPGLFAMGMRMVGPGDHEVRHARAEGQVPAADRLGRHLVPGLFRAGIGLRPRQPQDARVRDGDDYVINGTKIWTTRAHFADHMFCLVRTATEGKPQAGISFVLMNMDTPGLRVKPIITLAGDHEVNQVFFDNVRTPAPTASARRMPAGRSPSTCSSSSVAAMPRRRTSMPHRGRPAHRARGGGPTARAA